ncbi:sigma-54-dependent transcriptional regulator [Sediminispirochaeta smaragdinae]|uniref:Two component, sigma54 specific, transcriptional regulator, Fis family n=1 Tax=Sediminispirochaeta smaragdinae (strain DSM 11293 / JCM 15392 / SEBR 4228) TaxID=573413 RepID=E1R8F1_SEDSS|nr:sigma-54 dependent transcriptional regulator [Sediminispirochaeta smaragdinae]ADK79295.1 putative two component, sigma54 specific, transcriptional regulator, Fis family [Sediminispirochaeta smaragdinae DSM 11293]
MITILYIDDDLHDGELVHSMLFGYRVVLARNGTAGLEAYYRFMPDIVILDILLPDMNGLELLDRLPTGCEQHPEIIALSGVADPGLAQEVRRRGVKKFLRKPIESKILKGAINELLRGNGAAGHGQLQEHPPEYENTLNVKSPAFASIIGSSRIISRLKDRAHRYARCSFPVLILGESGTGKELFAKSIHELSRRCKDPFIVLNCAALPDTLIESELFGTEAGAFTGAVNRAGGFELANGGTLFLDEIGELSPSGQAKLLRILEEKVVYRLGSRRARKIDVRFVAATNKDLFLRAEGGMFRKDLFYRISGLELHIPPLRERKEDIEELSDTILRKGVEGAESNRHYRLSAGALAQLRAHHWPGNVRELEHVLHRAMLHSDSAVIEAAHLEISRNGRGYASLPMDEKQLPLF